VHHVHPNPVDLDVKTLFLLLLPVLGVASAAPAPAPQSAPTSIASAVKSLNPQADVTQVSGTPIAGLKEVRAGNEIVYMSEDGKYLFAGDLIEVASRENLTEVARSSTRAKALSSSNRQEHIVYGPAKNEKKVYVFTDTSCPYCTRFHEEVPKLVAAGITVEYLAWPRGGPRSPAFANMQSVWCSKDRNAAYDKVIQGADLPMESCEHTMQAQYELGVDLNVQGTPAVFAANGTQLGGYVPAQQIIEALND